MKNKTPTKRMFLGLPLSPDKKAVITQWQNQLNWPFNAVPTDNFHITLVFLGIVDSAQEDAICQICSSVKFKKFDLTLTDLTHWKKPKAIVLNTDSVPHPLASLVNQLEKEMIKLDISIQQRDYHPHVTLYRKANHLPINKNINLPLTFSRFCLFYSRSTENGVCYSEIKQWDLL